MSLGAEDTKSDFTRDTEATGYRIHNLVSPYRQGHLEISDTSTLGTMM